MNRKAKIKYLIIQAVLFFSDIIIAASGLDETIDVKSMVKDFFMYSSLLLQHLRNRLAKAFSYMGLRMVKYKVFCFYGLLLPAGVAVMLHFTTATISVLFAMMGMATILMKKSWENDFTTGSFPVNL